MRIADRPICSGGVQTVWSHELECRPFNSKIGIAHREIRRFCSADRQIRRGRVRTVKFNGLTDEQFHLARNTGYRTTGFRKKIPSFSLHRSFPGELQSER